MAAGPLFSFSFHVQQSYHFWEHETKKDPAQKLKRKARYSQLKMLINICNNNGINMPVMALSWWRSCRCHRCPANDSELFHNISQYDCYYHRQRCIIIFKLISHLPLAALQRFQMKISIYFHVNNLNNWIVSNKIDSSNCWRKYSNRIESNQFLWNGTHLVLLFLFLFIFISRFLSSHFIFVLIFKLQWMQYFSRFVLVLFIERYCSPCCDCSQTVNFNPILRLMYN